MTGSAASPPPNLEPVIGLEVHVQLATASKLFCSCPAASFGALPNSAVCPVCTGQPGSLPVLNRGAVERAFLAALALGGRIRPKSVFARKNYFYPDLPKGYQISQYEAPFSEGGGVDILLDGGAKRIALERIHMEEDAGKLVHDMGSEVLPYSLVDFNRSGVPLIEIVSNPDLRSPQEAHQYLTEIKAVLQYVGVSHCDMEKGEMRCDANISLRLAGAVKFGVKTEIKNLNSFRAVRDALEYEVARQTEVLRKGGRIVQETRLWDDLARQTRTMRTKEEAHDYRYFPEPDLVPLAADPGWVEALKQKLPELPRARRSRFMEKLKLSDYDAGVLTASRPLADYFEGVLASGKGKILAKTAANWITTELLGRLHAADKTIGDSPVPSERLGELLVLVEEGTLSGKLAKEILEKMWDTGRSPRDLVKSLGLVQVSDEGQLRLWAQAAVKENPKAVADYKGGNPRAIGALVGAIMKKSKGKANPRKVVEILGSVLES